MALGQSICAFFLLLRFLVPHGAAQEQSTLGRQFFCLVFIQGFGVGCFLPFQSFVYGSRNTQAEVQPEFYQSYIRTVSGISKEHGL